MAAKTDALVATLCCFLAISPCLLAAQSSSTLQDTTAIPETLKKLKEDILEITLEDGSVSFETKLAGTNPEANGPPVAGAKDSPARPSAFPGVDEDVPTDTTEASTSSQMLLDLKELTALEYDSLITNAFSQPACILFSSQRRGTSIVEKLFLQVWATSEAQEEFSSVFSVGKIYDPTLMDVTSIISIPRARPSLCCYRGETPVCFYGDHTAARLKDWFYIQKNKAKNSKSDIHAISVDRELHTNEVTVLGFARTEDQFAQLLKIFNRLEKLFPEVKVLLVPRESPDTKKITQQFSVNTFPAVLLVSKANPHQPFKHLIGHDLTLSTIELHIEVTLQKVAVKLTSETFPSRALEQRYAGPILVCFYSQREKRSLSYVKSFLYTADWIKKLGAAFRFGLVDLSVQRDILAKGWVDSTLVHQIPFIVLFSNEKVNQEGKTVTKQRLFSHSSPEPVNVLRFLEDVGVPLKDHKGMQIVAHLDTPMCEMGAPFSPGVLNSVCVMWQNETASTEELGLHVPKKKKTQMPVGKGQVKAAKKTGEIPVLTGSNWDHIISTTHAAPPPYGLTGSTSLVQIVAVTFIKGNCDTCTKKMPEFELVHKAVERMMGVTFYIFNCSSDPAKCEQQGISGFPTFVAYRVVQNKRVEHCTQNSTYDSIRLDYHDVLSAGKVLEWLSKVTESATHYVSKTSESDFQDVALFAEAAADTVAVEGYSFKCFEYLCERLYGQVACYVLSKTDANGEAAILSISLHRSDGLKAPIFVAGQPLASVMESESESQLHHFHSPHKYDLEPNTLCEDDQAFCTDTLLSFIQDHSRLPVMRITQQLFHTHQKNLLLNTDVPILIALGHDSNFTQESPFYNNLYSAALSMYRFMSFATLDVDMYPMWAGQFVPLGYRREMLETTDAGSLHLNPPTLYTYPRLCIVRWHDHRHAAFYPDLSEKRWQRQHRSFTSSEIVKFAEDFLRDPDKLLTRTEMF
ncbi:Hypp3323 [Branchiostoma lanceolatum]|uniref:Hypp3323 protein n=1 Tax=Branchiostoma lanceolatum TaxID=7740 RepID=A0A8J9ZZK0_BRALA|nr:Hypp3323 [Branchiostoma lanceolatum]